MTQPANAARPEYHVDAISTIEEYLDQSDWRVNANANQDYSVGGLITAGRWLRTTGSQGSLPEAGMAHRR